MHRVSFECLGINEFIQNKQLSILKSIIIITIIIIIFIIIIIDIHYKNGHTIIHQFKRNPNLNI